MQPDSLRLELRSRRLQQDAGGFSQWREHIDTVDWPCAATALLLCDVWDRHWSRGASERVDAMVGRMDQVVAAARGRGLQIVHAPSDTMEFYAGTPARQRLRAAPEVMPPAALERPDPPLPIDASDGGSDTGESGEESHRAWSRQHPGIAIDQERDGISDDGREVYGFLAQQGIENLLVMGVHTNMCVLNRSFAIKQMVRWGMRVALIRDLTDAMYNPARPPYVSHAEGTDLVIGYIERFWCPSVDSGEITETRVVE